MLSLGRLEYWGTVQASHSQFAEMTLPFRQDTRHSLKSTNVECGVKQMDVDT